MALLVGGVDRPAGGEVGLHELGALDAVVDRGRPDAHGDRPAATGGGLVDIGLQQHAVGGVVLELHVQVAVVEGRLATGRVAVEVHRVWVVLDVLETREEDRIEGRGAALGDATGVLLDQVVTADHPAVDVARTRTLGAQGVVQAEGLPRLYEGVVYACRSQRQVGVAVLGIGEVGGELTRDLLDPELRGLRGGQVGLLLGDRDADRPLGTGGGEGRGDGLEEGVLLQALAVLGGHDDGLAAVQPDPGVHRFGEAEPGGGLLHIAPELAGVRGHGEGVFRGGDLGGSGELLGAQGDLALAGVNDDRRRQRGAEGVGDDLLRLLGRELRRGGGGDGLGGGRRQPSRTNGLGRGRLVERLGVD